MSDEARELVGYLPFGLGTTGGATSTFLAAIATEQCLTRPVEITAMTAQHAMRQGALPGRNVAASLGHGTIAKYKHHNLGFVVDLGGWQAAANPNRAIGDVL